MEVSNRTFGIFCVVVFGVVVYVRGQSVKPQAAFVASTPAVADPAHTRAPAVARRGIPDASLPPDTTVGFVAGDVPVILTNDTAPPVVIPTDKKPAATAPASAPPASAPVSAPENITEESDLGDLSTPPATNSGSELSDRDMLRIMWATLNEQQRADFRALWFTMSPDDRQNLIDEVRGNQQGG